jgi:peptide/nickel transport system substrate-binding protein
MRKQTLLLLTLVLVSGLCLQACAPAATPTPTPKPVPTATAAPPTPVPPTPTPEPHDDLNIAVQLDANLLNPYLGFNSTETFCIGSIYETLFSYDYETGLGPGLADSFDWDMGNVGMTVHLNPDAQWQDGTPVTADDVVFSFTYIQQQQFPIFFAIARTFGGAEKVDDHTVHFQFNGPSVDGPRFIGTAISIVPQHIWESITDGQNFPNVENPIGSGSFKLKEKVPGQYIVLEAVPHYRYSYNFKTITLRIVSDETMGVLALKNGDFDALDWNVAAEIAADVRDNPNSYPNIQLAQAQGLSTTALMFNLRKAPYDNMAFRKALAPAIDVDGLVERVWLGFADRVGPGLFPPAVKEWWNPDIPLIEYDPNAAMAALDAAGFTDADSDGWRDTPDGEPIDMSILCTTTQTDLDAVEWIVTNLAAVGIKATADPVDPAGLRTVQKKAEFDGMLSGPNLSEPGMIAYYLGSSRGVIEEGNVVGFNFGGYASEQFDQIATASSMAFDKEQRAALLYQAQELLAEDLPMVPLYINQILNLYRDDRFEGWVVEDAIGVLNQDTFLNLTSK